VADSPELSGSTVKITESLPKEPTGAVLLDSRTAVAGAALRRALGKAGIRLFQRKAQYMAVITVPNEQWTDAVHDCVRELTARSALIVVGSEKPKTRETNGGLTAQASAEGKTVIGVSHSPQRLLPDVLLATATHSFLVPPLNSSLLAEAMKGCLVGKTPSALDELSVDGMDFDTVCACMPRGISKAEAVDRLRRARERCSDHAPASTEWLPRLEDAIEYGQARDWGLELKRDISDLRSGQITWSDLDRGAILEGPPGTGKTTFAKMLARSCDLPFVSASVSEFFASGAGNLDSVIKAQRAVFTEAAEKAPSILFLDEINALPDPATMSPRGRDWWLPVIYDFYLLLDSSISARDGVVVIGATNLIMQISPALLRPGRLERAIHIGIPTIDGLANILRTHLGNDLKDDDLHPLARAGVGATAAEAMEWVRSARRTSRRAGRAMNQVDLLEQITPAETRSETDRFRCAVHEAGHGVIGLVLGEPLVEISIVPRGNSGGRTTFTDVGSAVFDKLAIDNKVTMILAGMAAEMRVLGSVSNGSGGADSSDLAKATDLLASTRLSFGMRGELLWRAGPGNTRQTLERDPALRAAVEDDLQRIFGQALALVDHHHRRIRQAAAGLMKAGTISGTDLRELIGGDLQTAVT
jgi:cell division protease FtsH